MDRSSLRDARVAATGLVGSAGRLDVRCPSSSCAGVNAHGSPTSSAMYVSGP